MKKKPYCRLLDKIKEQGRLINCGCRPPNGQDWPLTRQKQIAAQNQTENEP
jgi:hypothetical protein